MALIREAREHDLPTIAEITNHYVATTTIHFAYEPVAVEEFRVMWSRRDRYPWLVAEGDSVVLGYAKAGVWRERAAYGWTTELGLYVAPNDHRRGLGKALYGDLLRELGRRGFHSAIAGITLPNEPSVALHRAFGFVSVGIVREAGFKFDRWHDVEFWQKQLGGASA